jgi:hypothetical protein
MGHRRALYWGYPLSEGALVAEACNLIYANLGDGERLLCEERYSHLVPHGRWPACLGPKARADLVVVAAREVKAAEPGGLLSSASVVVEVKRASAGSVQIDRDLKRLAALKAENSGVRALLFLVSEARRPTRFVSTKGVASRTRPRIPTTAFHYAVRSVKKAASTFVRVGSANYVCVIEVLNGQPA